MFAISSRKSSLVLTAILLTCCSPLATTTAWAMDPPVVEKGLVAQMKSKGPLMDAIGLYEEKRIEDARLAFEKIAEGGGTIAVVYLHNIDQKKYDTRFNDLPDYSKKLGKVHLDASLAYMAFKDAPENKKKANILKLSKMMFSQNTHALSLFIKIYEDKNNQKFITSLPKGNWLIKVKSKEDFYTSYEPKVEGGFAQWDCFDGDYLCKFGKIVDPKSDLFKALKMFETSYTRNPENIVNIAKVLARLCPSAPLWTQLAIENGCSEFCFPYAKNLYMTLKLPDDTLQMLPMQPSTPFNENQKNYFDLSKYYLTHHLKLDHFPPDKKENVSHEAGDMLYIYGTIYQEGFFGVKKDDTDAFFYLEKAANLGNKIIQYNFALELCNQGDEQSLKKALKYFTLAAEQGVCESQNRLAEMYYRGQGCTKNLEKSFQWAKKSAENGSILGLYNCGSMLEMGEGTPQNYTEALKYYERTRSGGSLMANVNLAGMYCHGRGCEKDLAKAAALYQESAENGTPEGQYNFARMFQFGMGVLKDSKKAIDYYKMAENQGFLLATINLAALLAETYVDESPESPNFAEAIFYNEKLANSHKMPEAEHNCSVLYYNKGGLDNLKKALLYSERAAQQGLAAAQNSYGYILCFENTEFYDLKKARHYFELAAAQGCTDALIRLNLLDQQLTTTQSPEIEDQSEFIEISVPLAEGPADSSDEEQDIAKPVLPEIQENAQAATPEINVNVVPQIHPDIPQIKPDVPQIPLPKKPKKVLPQEDSQEEENLGDGSSEDLTQSQELARELALCDHQNAQRIRELRIKKEKAKAYQVLRLKRKDYDKTCTSFPNKMADLEEKKKLVVSNNTMEFVKSIFGQGIKINTFSNDEAKKAFAELGCTVAQKKGENSTILIYNLGGDREMELQYEECGEEENAPSTDQKAKYHNPHGHGDNKMYKALMPPLRRYLQSIGITPERLEVK